MHAVLQPTERRHPKPQIRGDDLAVEDEGKHLAAVTGEDLLAYAELVQASGRIRREHLAWELMVELGPFADEATTLRAMWSAKGNSRQHSTTGLVDR
ncbi:hypothetical protein [Nocardia nova]|uniref:hypothetical protein n=1 Tax=Nocardia nova TaxID=37330 RepID=UPI0018954187|nr:hypothetical protein [Nocardia nova]MBF6149568.1 hypothetical protein [Nocardia nova]